MTTPSPDFRKLCADLLDCLEKANWPLRHKTIFELCVDSARAALSTPPPEPVADQEIAAALQKGADQEFYATVEALTEYCGAGVELTDSDAREVLYELRRKQNTKTKPEPPTDDELNALWDCCGDHDEEGDHYGNIFQFARAAIKRWGK